MHDATVGLGAHALDQALGLETVDHARDRAGIDVHLARQLDRRGGAANLEHPQRLPLRIGEIVLGHAPLDLAPHLLRQVEQPVADALGHFVAAAVVQRGGLDCGRGHGVACAAAAAWRSNS